jgi:3-hydroxybutyryl-CoA dehydrogenase
MIEIGIIGSGKMGTDIFNYLSDFEIRINWICGRSGEPEKLFSKYEKKLSRNLKNGIMTDESFHRSLDKIKISHDLSILRQCRFILEAIDEDLDKKNSLFREMDGLINHGCIFASNSSSFKPSRMIPCLLRKDKFVNLHFFYPLKLMDIVEVVYPENASKETVEFIDYFLGIIKKKPLIQNEKNAFILNRIFLEVQAEAYRIFENTRMTIREIDNLIKDDLSSFGAFELIDNVGIRTIFNSVSEYINEYENKGKYLPLLNCLDRMIGMKISGFYSSEFDENEFKKSKEGISIDTAKMNIENSFLSFLKGLKKSEKQENFNFALNQFLGTDVDYTKKYGLDL